MKLSNLATRVAGRSVFEVTGGECSWAVLSTLQERGSKSVKWEGKCLFVVLIAAVGTECLTWSRVAGTQSMNTDHPHTYKLYTVCFAVLSVHISLKMQNRLDRVQSQKS